MAMTRTERTGATILICWLAVTALTAIEDLKAAAALFIIGAAACGLALVHRRRA